MFYWRPASFAAHDSEMGRFCKKQLTAYILSERLYPEYLWYSGLFYVDMAEGCVLQAAYSYFHIAML